MSSKYIESKYFKINKLNIPKNIIDLLSNNIELKDNITFKFDNRDINIYFDIHSIKKHIADNKTFYTITLPITKHDEYYEFHYFSWGENKEENTQIFEKGLVMLQEKYDSLFNKDNEKSKKIINQNRIKYSKCAVPATEFIITKQLYDILCRCICKTMYIGSRSIVFKYDNTSIDKVLFFDILHGGMKSEYCTYVDKDNIVYIRHLYANNLEKSVDLISHGISEIDAKYIIEDFNKFEIYQLEKLKQKEVLVSDDKNGYWLTL